MLPVEIASACRAHAGVEYPRESCGVVIVARGRAMYRPCRNVAPVGSCFEIHGEDLAAAEEIGVITHVVHSHPDAAPAPSQADRVMCERTGVPWVIVGWPSGALHEHRPDGYQAPLVGREFVHGVLDCYSLIRDWYQAELGLTLPDYDRDDRWWLRGEDLYMQWYADAGFVRAADGPQRHDVVLMQFGAPVVNHGGVYLGDGLILQHCAGRLSSRDVYGGFWRRCTRALIRHRSLS
ncbi:MAG: C40 family peptidase [Gammaproteobacteria bacterium]|nr:C40 family peptidase [Gammaproteobacteria bacterium]